MPQNQLKILLLNNSSSRYMRNRKVQKSLSHKTQYKTKNSLKKIWLKTFFLKLLQKMNKSQKMLFNKK